MPVIPVTEPFKVELYGEAHPPYGESVLELCALLFGGDTPVPFAFKSTSERDYSAINGVEAHDRIGEYVSISIDVATLSSACTHLVIAAHVQELNMNSQYRGAAMAINPTFKRLTHSVRALGFGDSASFMDEDAVYGVQLFTLDKTEEGWSLDDDQRPTPFSELVELAWEYGGIELTPWPA